jgi:RNA 2',3'-cyclic 3'-phosphodiesterase
MRVRLFVALDFPDAIRDAIRRLVDGLKPLAQDARWVRMEAMHVTLKFIGHVGPEQRERIVSALDGIHPSAAVEMRFRGLGFFPTEQRPRVLWCGISASPNLAELAAAIERALIPIGVAAETRVFVPHLTLARFNAPHRLGPVVARSHEIGSVDLGATRQTQFHLFESELKRSGPEYTKLKSFLFAKEPV